MTAMDNWVAAKIKFSHPTKHPIYLKHKILTHTKVIFYKKPCLIKNTNKIVQFIDAIVLILVLLVISSRGEVSF